MWYWRSCLLEGRYYRRACFAVGDVLLGMVVIPFMRICVMGGNCMLLLLI